MTDIDTFWGVAINKNKALAIWVNLVLLGRIDFVLLQKKTRITMTMMVLMAS